MVKRVPVSAREPRRDLHVATYCSGRAFLSTQALPLFTPLPFPELLWNRSVAPKEYEPRRGSGISARLGVDGLTGAVAIRSQPMNNMMLGLQQRSAVQSCSCPVDRRVVLFSGLSL